MKSTVAVFSLYLLLPAAPTVGTDCDGWNTEEFFKTATVEEVTGCLQTGADPNTRTKEGNTPLHAAVHLNPSLLTPLIEAGANPNARDKEGYTPLHRAGLRNKPPEVITTFLLMPRIVIPDRVWYAYSTGAFGQIRKLEESLGVSYSQFIRSGSGSALAEGYKDIYAEFPPDSARTPTASKDLGRNPRDRNPDVIAALLDAGADANSRDKNGFTSLHFAAACTKDLETISVLLKAGADPNARDKHGNTFLHSAVWNKNPEILPALLNSASDLNVQDNYGSTFLHYAAARNENPTVIAALLKTSGDPNARDKHGNTYLHYAAARNKNPAVITALLDAGADPATRNTEGKIPWDYAKENEALKETDVYWRLHDARFE